MTVRGDEILRRISSNFWICLDAIPMISAFVILGSRGDILINRLFRDDVGNREPVEFSNKFVATREVTQAAPINSIANCHFLHTVQGMDRLIIFSPN